MPITVKNSHGGPDHRPFGLDLYLMRKETFDFPVSRQDGKAPEYQRISTLRPCGFAREE
jgi:hypothetical protein